MPLALLVIEFALNNLVIEWRQLAPVFVYLVSYLAVNYAYSREPGRQVYSILSFEDASSWYLVLAI